MLSLSCVSAYPDLRFSFVQKDLITPRFDIFKVEKGMPIWLECAETLEQCRNRLLELKPQYAELSVWDSRTDVRYGFAEFLALRNRDGESKDCLTDLCEQAAEGQDGEIGPASG